jgi:hypothetical protein
VIAWDEMSEDDKRLVALFPVGCRFSLIIAGYTKWALAACSMGAKAQLEMLEGIAGLADGFFNARALAEVRPCCEVSAQMIETALRNDGDERCSKSFNVLTRAEIFGELLRLNPSWLRAIRLCGYGGAGRV